MSEDRGIPLKMMTEKQYRHLLKYIETNVGVLFFAMIAVGSESTRNSWIAVIIMAGFCIYSAMLKRNIPHD